MTDTIRVINEYDRAVADSFGRESHRPVMDFLMEFMHSSLKNNNSLQLACLTGVMRIHDDDIFPDIGHVRVDDIFSESSDDRFGFTEDKVMMVLGDYGHREKMDEAREWYSGYRFGKTDMYNPFAVMEYISDGFEPRPYWSDSGGDVIFRWLLERMDERNNTEVASLQRRIHARETAAQPQIRNAEQQRCVPVQSDGDDRIHQGDKCGFWGIRYLLTESGCPYDRKTDS